MVQVGADVRAWFAAMPRVTRMRPEKRPAASLALPQQHHQQGGGGGSASNGGGLHQPLLLPAVSLLGSSTIDQFYLSRHCAVCDALTRPNRSVCDACFAEPQATLAVLQARVSRLERQHRHITRICLHCSSGGACLPPPAPGGGGGGAVQANSNALPPLAAAAAAAAAVQQQQHPHVRGGPQLPQQQQPGVSAAQGVNGFLASALHADGGVVCDSLDCGAYFERRKLAHELSSLSALLRASEHEFAGGPALAW